VVDEYYILQSMSEREVLLMSDSRASGWAPTNIDGWTVRPVVRRGASLAVLTAEVEKYLHNHTGLVVMVAIHCELTFHLADFVDDLTTVTGSDGVHLGRAPRRSP
jgi:hypothetical protein